MSDNETLSRAEHLVRLTVLTTEERGICTTAAIASSAETDRLLEIIERLTGERFRDGRPE
jgi:hypothetical protein